MRVKCTMCGYEKEVDYLSGGIINDTSAYGHHSCSNGELGTFIETKKSKGKGNYEKNNTRS